MIQHFGQDFERNLLLALGYAARIYPKIWDGLATDRPTGCQLGMDEALAFLKESAWVLGDAGYTVIVPAWWTPEGRRRTKIRLKTSLRSPKKGTAAVSQGYFSLDAIISYQYQLSIGGQVVTEKAILKLAAPSASASAATSSCINSWRWERWRNG